MDNIYLFLLVFHIFVVGSLFLFIGINKDKTPDKLFNIVYYLGILIVLYHSYKAHINFNPWVNLIHIIIIGPLLFYIGKTKQLTPYYLYEIMLLLGFSTIGYNSYKLYNYIL